MLNIKIIGYILCLMFFISCENETDNQEIKSTVQFSFQNKTKERHKKAAITDVKKMIISIEQNGNPVHSQLELTVQNFNGNFITLPIALTVGNYSLTEFMLLNDSNQVIYATPIEGSPTANLVNDPLPIEFTVVKDQTITVSPEVISTENLTAADFGYASFSFNLVETMQFRIIVQAYNENSNTYNLISSHLEVRSGTKIDFNDSIPAATSLITVRDLQDSIYTITVTKAGFETYVQSFQRDSLVNYKNTPLIFILDKNRVIKIISGMISLALKSDNSLWAAGRNLEGQFGIGTSSNSSYFIKIANEIKSFSVGASHIMIIKSDNSLWANGQNYSGQLGDGTNINKNVFEQVMTDVKIVSCGPYNTFCIKLDGTLWATGQNFDGQLGDGTRLMVNTFKLIANSVKDVSAGEDHTLIIKADGTLWVAGTGSTGQLGDGTLQQLNFKQVMSEVIAVSAGYNHSMVLKSNGTLWLSGNNYYGQIGNGTNINQNYFIEILSDVKSISGGNHSFALKVDGTLWGAGDNRYGELGDGSNISKNNFIMIDDEVKEISALSHSSYIKENNTLWTSGWNLYGQLGDGTNTDKNRFVQINL
jgi:alpha-tubulin suppressor-like RCC1 family protein